MTRLRKLMLEELQRRNFSSDTIRGYLGAVEQFARYFGKPPDRLGPDHIRQWQVHLLHERKLAVGTVVNRVAALRFFFRRVLKRRFPPDSIPYPNYSHHRTPRVLSPEEVARLIEAAGNLQARTILMTLYSTGMRRSELVRLRLGNHLKTGQALSLQNRPTAPIQNNSCYTVPECDPTIVIRSSILLSCDEPKHLGEAVARCFRFALLRRPPHCLFRLLRAAVKAERERVYLEPGRRVLKSHTHDGEVDAAGSDRRQWSAKALAMTSRA